jgi:ATP-dependent RNA helicase DeaD
MELPGAELLNAKRIQAFQDNIRAVVAEGELEPFVGILRELCAEQDLDPIEVAAALAKKAQGKTPLLVKDVVLPARKPARMRADRAVPEPGLVRYRLAVGHKQGANPNHIVGAIANEAGLTSRQIGRITINHDHSLVDLPEGLPASLVRKLRKVRVCNVALDLELASELPAGRPGKGFRPARKGANPKRRFVGKR